MLNLYIKIDSDINMNYFHTLQTHKMYPVKKLLTLPVMADFLLLAEHIKVEIKGGLLPDVSIDASDADLISTSYSFNLCNDLVWWKKRVEDDVKEFSQRSSYVTSN